MQVIVDDLLINYQRQGKGKLLVLLHGWGSSLVDLDPLFQGLAKNYEVIALDLPGLGASQSPSDNWDLNSYAKFLGGFTNKLELKNIYALVGHSNGGAIAIKGLADNTLSADKLVLISSAGIRDNAKTKRAGLKALTKVGKIASSPLPAATKKKLRSKLYTAIGSDYLVAEHLSETFKNIVSEDLQSQAKLISIPTLLIYGEKDNQTPVAYGQLYHQLIADSTLEEVGGAGHFVFQEKPELVVKLIKDFLC
jgi:pimeloyl-ACP methyl ester carboxylesterase